MKYAIGVDLGGTNSRVALITSRARIVDTIACSSKEVKSPKLFIPWVTVAIQTLIKRNNIPKKSVLGVGMGIPGSVDPKKGIVHFLPNLPYWKNVDLAKKVSQKLKMVVKIDNDGNSMALGECLFGAAKGAKQAVFLTLGTGLGGGVLINGEILHGRNFSACEIAHMRHGDSRIQCACGSIGCIETAVGNGYLIKKVKADLKKGGSKILKKLIQNEPDKKFRLKHIDMAAYRGDAYSIRFWRNVGEKLGDFLGGICNLLNPEVIILGGGVMGAGDLILKPLKKSLKQNTFPLAFKGLRVLKAKLGNKAGMIGSASLILAGNTRN